MILIKREHLLKTKRQFYGFKTYYFYGNKVKINSFDLKRERWKYYNYHLKLKKEGNESELDR